MRLCFRCHDEKFLVKNCKSDRACGVNGCTKTHNRLLHQTTESEQTPEKSETNASTNITQNDHSALFQLVKIKLKSKKSGFSTKTKVLLDSGSTVFYIDKTLAEKLKCASKRNVSMNVNGIFGTVELDCQQDELLVEPINQSKPTETIFSFTHSKMEIGNGYLNYKQLKLQDSYLNFLPDTSMRLEEVKMIIGQDTYSLMRPIE